MRGPTNYQLQNLLVELESKGKDSKFWRRVVKDLKKPSRQRREVNLYKIAQYAKDGETVLVPGKVLSIGEISRPVEVAAINFSAEAERKITSAKGKVISINDLFKQNPQGKKVRILG
ncbi:MAG: 50S ribosomal protein L18e [Nanoarchaeota archaeon]|nr:50S ribosomal protein L18e [Nanoarchaeota archaeon]MBU1623044.1 50S ribosomal protein L18e [Nanoarchaeota archaeon]MBU1974226.1 50S ribosomal protein L18e [Nanoarchaeota archaeon]